MIGDFFFEPLPVRLGWVRPRCRMRAETAQFHAVVAQVLQLVQHDVKIERRLFLVEDVRPTADGEFLGHCYASRVSKDGVRSPHRDTHDPTQRREDSQRKSANTNASREFAKRSLAILPANPA